MKDFRSTDSGRGYVDIYEDDLCMFCNDPKLLDLSSLVDHSSHEMGVALAKGLSNLEGDGRYTADLQLCSV